MSELKYVIFFLVLLFGVPFNYIMARKFPKYEKVLWFLLLFFTCNMVDINFFSHEHYRGTSRGFEIGMVDILTFSLLAVIIGRRKEYPIKRPPGTFLYFTYFFFSLLSLVNSDVYLYSFFELWKMIRMYIFFYVVYNMIRQFEDITDMMVSISIITIYITYIVLKQKYLMGIFQTYGPFPHQNSLVLYMIMYGSMLLSLLLNKEDIKLYYWLPVFGMASIDIVSTLSRAGLAMYAMSIIMIFYFSYRSHFSLRKVGVTFLFLLLGSIVMYKAMDSIIERVQTAPEESANTRIRLAIAARKMADDKILGIGLNNFGLKINDPYPYGAHIPRNDPYEKGGLVETIYLMIAAETGWHNLVVFFIFILYFYGKNLRNYFRMKGHPYRFIPIGIAGGLTAWYIQSTLEWVLKQTNNYYQMMFVFALIAAVSRMLDEETKKKKR
ncbi:O-antigen ligase family protein [Sulfurovum sp. ST-21]|uniref:O-antigen ligase-related domain-containing protein n=1 Tax=Sulfurovum indicum TaxID=2779528 RepID=A0A7M1S6G4_9BACT|nr:O-antigen ligase family protein [Sulfurovum indicum]QOR61950.1 hypothetical protein IMZ28_00200 [Sulfurovum indicum]